MKHNALLNFLRNRAEWLVAGTGAVMVMAAAGTVALQTHTARAAVETAHLPVVLPTLTVVAAADTAAADANKDAPKDDMRARFRERMQERMKEHAQDHPGEQAKEHPPVDKHLTNDQVRDIVAGRLAMMGNANLKVGKVAAKDNGIVAVDIVTKTGALVDTREISTKSGLPAALETRMAEHKMGEHMMGEHMGEHGPGAMAGGDHPFLRHMMERRMMGEHGMGGGMGERDGKGPHRDLALTVDQAKKLAEARLIMLGNPHLKIGAVKEKDADTISVDIVASDNSLVTQRLIDRHTGRPQRAG